MRTAQAVAWKEIQIYFSSPTAYIVGLIFLALTGFFFTQDLGDPFPEATLVPFFDGAIVIFILLAPALTMRLLAEESKLGTIELLLTSPVRDTPPSIFFRSSDVWVVTSVPKPPVAILRK